MIHTVCERSAQATIELTTTINGRTRKRRRNRRRSGCITTRLTSPDTKTTPPIPVVVVVLRRRRRRRRRRQITTCQVVIDVDARRTSYVKTTTSPAQQQQQQQRRQLLTSLRRRRRKQQQRRRRRHTTMISSRQSERSVYWNVYARCRQTTGQTYHPVVDHRRPNVETIRPNLIEKFPLCRKMCHSLNAAVLHLMCAKIVHLVLKMFRPDPEVFRPARLETYRRSAAYRPARRERNAHDESIIAAAT